MLKAGSIIGERYVLGRLIGKGGMSTVHEATHQQLGKKVAIKLLTGGYDENPAAVRRFLQEAQIAGNLGHPNICAVMDFGTTESGVPYLVMELLEGESLAATLKRDGTVPVDDALRIILQALEALEEVHSRGVVHRDLKPGNLFITSARGYGMIVKLLDFGISKVMKSSTTTSLTQTGTALGTPNYMSPEQIRESKVIDQRADLYSIGVILFKMLSGRAPYDKGPISEVILKIMEGPVPSLAEAAPDIPPALASLVLRSMQKDPAQRFQSAREFKDEIRKIQADLGCTAPSTTARAGVRESVGGAPDATGGRSRARIAWVVGAAVLAALCTAGAVLLYPLLTGKTHDTQGTKKGEGVQTKLAAIKGQEPHGNAAPSAKIPPKETGEAGKVRIDFIGVPGGVAIECKACEGAVVGSKTLEVNKGSSEIAVLLRADEYEEKLLKLVPSRDMAVDVTLVPLSAGKPKHAKKKKDGDASASTGNGKSKPEDIDHVWDYPSQ